MTYPESTSTPAPSLSYRLATSSDEDELVKMRIACGWGDTQVSARLRRSQMGLDFPCIFFLDETEMQAVGMGSIELLDSGQDDRDLADPETKTVMISALFVYPKLQGQGYGNKIMDLLELQSAYLGMETCTIHTLAFEKDGTTESRTSGWYRRREYEEIKEPELRYRTVMSVFLKKEVPPLPAREESMEDASVGIRLEEGPTKFERLLSESLGSSTSRGALRDGYDSSM